MGKTKEKKSKSVIVAITLLALLVITLLVSIVATWEKSKPLHAQLLKDREEYTSIHVNKLKSRENGDNLDLVYEDVLMGGVWTRKLDEPLQVKDTPSNRKHLKAMDGRVILIFDGSGETQELKKAYLPTSLNTEKYRTVYNINDGIIEKDTSQLVKTLEMSALIQDRIQLIFTLVCMVVALFFFSALLRCV